MRDKRLTDVELSQTEDAAKNVRPERNVEPVMINRISNGENIIQQKEQAGKIEQVNYELEPEAKEFKEEMKHKI